MSSRSSASSQQEVVAAFDFDKTLSRRDCVVPFARKCLSTQRIFRALTDGPQVLLASAGRNRDRLKEILTMRAFAGWPREALEAKAEEFARFVQEHWMRSDTVSTLRWHGRAGHRTGLVSASYGLYLRPIARTLGMDFVIASELEFDQNDIATGRLIGGNCRGPEKRRRLEQWLKSQGLEDSRLYAYGDSEGDKELLEMSHYAHLVGKERAS